MCNFALKLYKALQQSRLWINDGLVWIGNCCKNKNVSHLNAQPKKRGKIKNMLSQYASCILILQSLVRCTQQMSALSFEKLEYMEQNTREKLFCNSYTLPRWQLRNYHSHTLGHSLRILKPLENCNSKHTVVN